MARLPRTVVPGHPHHVTQRSNRRVKYPVPGTTHPALGRWMQRDPIGYGDGMGLYEYARSAPTLRFDAFGLASDCCGPDITELLESMLQKIDTDWDSSSREAKNRICNGIWNIGAGGKPWDIDEMHGDLPTVNRFVSGPCPGEDSPCWRTVSVYDKCFDTAQVNYILWGKMNRLCKSSLRQTMGAAYAYKGVNAAADPFREFLGDGSKGYLESIPEAMEWAAAGYFSDTGLREIVDRMPFSHDEECEVAGCQTTKKKPRPFQIQGQGLA